MTWPWPDPHCLHSIGSVELSQPCVICAWETETELKQHCRALLKAKYRPWVAAVLCMQKMYKKTVIPWDLGPWTWVSSSWVQRFMSYHGHKVVCTGAALPANPRPLRTDLSYPACIASGNFILEFPSIDSQSRLFSRWRMRASPRGLWNRRQVWLPRMRQRDACWAGEVSLKGSPIARLRNGRPVSRYLYIDLWLFALSHNCEKSENLVLWPWPLTYDLETPCVSSGCRGTCSCKISSS